MSLWGDRMAEGWRQEAYAEREVGVVLCEDQNIRLTSFNFEDVLRLSTAIRKVAGRDPGQARGV